MFVPEDALQVSHDALKYAAICCSVWHENRVLCFGLSWFDLVSWPPGKKTAVMLWLKIKDLSSDISRSIPFGNQTWQ